MSGLRRTRGPFPTVVWRVIRELATNPAGHTPTQKQVAETLHVTQPAVSLALRKIGASGYDWRDREQMIQLHREWYPGAGGEESWWSTRMGAEEVSERLIGQLGATMSGDLVAKEMAIWRTVDTVIAYVADEVDSVEMLGCGCIDQRGGGTDVLVVSRPADRSVLIPWRGDGGAGVHPLVVAHDLRHRLAGGDRDEAAERIETTLLAG